MDKQTLDLKDIHLPEPISWWPIASGWWLLLAGIVLIFIIFFILKKRHQKKQINREINTEIQQIKKQFKKTKSKSALAKSLSTLLRRVSISIFSEKEVAGLTGEQWLTFLDQAHKGSTQKHKFLSETGKALIIYPYLPDNSNFDFDAQTLITLCETWLKNAKQHGTPAT